MAAVAVIPVAVVVPIRVVVAGVALFTPEAAHPLGVPYTHPEARPRRRMLPRLLPVEEFTPLRPAAECEAAARQSSRASAIPLSIVRPHSAAREWARILHPDLSRTPSHSREQTLLGRQQALRRPAA